MLADLIERLEKLEGPDRETDQAIDLFFNPTASVWSPKWWSGAPNEFLIWGSEEAGDLDYRHIDDLTSSLDAAIALVERVLPGWGWRVATCSVSDDAWVFPDFNCPVHGERLRKEFRQDIEWTDLTDVDLRPPGRTAIALLIALLKAKEGQNG